MKKIYAVKDNATESFGLPFYLNTNGEAMRSFTDEANSRSENSAIAKHPEDYELYNLGEYDEQNASFKLSEKPERLARAKDLLKLEN